MAELLHAKKKHPRVAQGFRFGASIGRKKIMTKAKRLASLDIEWLQGETGQPYRLPKEAEWEYACRAGTTTRYSCGDEITKKDANLGKSGTTEVDAYPPNAWGLYDMHRNARELVELHGSVWKFMDMPGNVWKWVDDICRLFVSPTRGGCWLDSDNYPRCRSASRSQIIFGIRECFVGFRVVRGLD